jgi:hypothetical protein
MIDKYFEDKLESSIQKIAQASNELRYNSYNDLRNKLWKLEREAALLREFIDEEVAEDDYKEVI